MSNVRATVFDISIPLKSKTANNIEHDYNLLLVIKNIAISLKAQVLPVALIVWQKCLLLIAMVDVIDVF